MSRYVFKLPDLGEGTVSAEIVAWRAQPGDVVVEVPSPVSGRLVSVAGAEGDTIAVGAELAVFETDFPELALPPAAAVATASAPPATIAPIAVEAAPSAAASADRGRVRASPATRRRASEAGIDLTGVVGSGPGGRVQSSDLEQASATTEIKVVGVRRLIAERMSEAKRNIPHFAYVEEVDVTELEALRQHLNATPPAGAAPLSLLPLIVMALARVLRDFPQCNAHYDAARNVIVRHRSIHVGVATQTPDGLKVPVVRDVAHRSLRELAAEIRRVAEAARGNTARRDLLTGSTITVTSLGKLGGIVSTPILNAPEVAIVGINNAIERVVVVDGNMVVRRMMNLSSSFDHRFVDGYDAAAMIQALKGRLEHPATIFI
jgi:2-oxoisovalerate dehydrogenase E2 component (dihydrolipoyl transacylase)